MGVQGLTSFVRANIDRLSSLVRLGDVSKEQGHDITLICDGYALLAHILMMMMEELNGDEDRPKCPFRDILGGDYRDFHNTVRNFIRRFRSEGVNLVVVEDGARGASPKHQEWCERDKQQLEGILEIDKFCRGKRRSLPEEYIWPILVREQFNSTLTELGVELCTCPLGDADTEIHEMFRQHQRKEHHDDDSDDDSSDEEVEEYYAILSQDSDFLIFEGARYIPLETLHIDSNGEGGISCRVFKQEKLVSYLGLDRSPRPQKASGELSATSSFFDPSARLIELSCLAGNDFTRHYIRKYDIHLKLGLKKGGRGQERIHELVRVVHQACDFTTDDLRQKYEKKGKREEVDNESETEEGMGIERLPMIRRVMEREPKFRERVRYARGWYALRYVNTERPSDPFQQYVLACVACGAMAPQFVPLSVTQTSWFIPVPQQVAGEQPSVEAISLPLRQAMFALVSSKDVTEWGRNEQLTETISYTVPPADLPPPAPDRPLTPADFKLLTPQKADLLLHGIAHICLPVDGGKKGVSMPVAETDPLMKFSPPLIHTGLSLRYLFGLMYLKRGFRSLDPEGLCDEKLSSCILKSWELDAICAHALILNSFPDGKIPHVIVDMDVLPSIRTVTMSSLFQTVLKTLAHIAQFLATVVPCSDELYLCESIGYFLPYSVFEGSLFALAFASGGEVRTSEFVSRILNYDEATIDAATSSLSSYREAILFPFPDDIFAVVRKSAEQGENVFDVIGGHDKEEEEEEEVVVAIEEHHVEVDPKVVEEQRRAEEERRKKQEEEELEAFLAEQEALKQLELEKLKIEQPEQELVEEKEEKKEGLSASKKKKRKKKDKEAAGGEPREKEIENEMEKEKPMGEPLAEIKAAVKSPGMGKSVAKSSKPAAQLALQAAKKESSKKPPTKAKKKTPTYEKKPGRR